MAERLVVLFWFIITPPCVTQAGLELGGCLSYFSNEVVKHDHRGEHGSRQAGRHDAGVVTQSLHLDPRAGHELLKPQNPFIPSETLLLRRPHLLILPK